MSDAAVDTSSEITTKDLKEKKEVVEEAENGREAPANGNANEENGERQCEYTTASLTAITVTELPSAPESSVGKESACNAGDPALIPGSGRSTGEGIGYHSSILGLPWWLGW